MMQDLYVLNMRGTSMYKIGASKDIKKRIKGLQVGNPCILDIILLEKGKGALERDMHFKYRTFRKAGEWFEFDDIDTVINEIHGSCNEKQIKTIYKKKKIKITDDDVLKMHRRNYRHSHDYKPQYTFPEDDNQIIITKYIDPRYSKELEEEKDMKKTLSILKKYKIVPKKADAFKLIDLFTLREYKDHLDKKEIRFLNFNMFLGVDRGTSYE